MRASWVSLMLTAVVLAVTGAGVATDTVGAAATKKVVAKKKPVTCKAGQAKLTLGTSVRCVAPSTLMPKPAPAPNPLTRWTRVALDQTLATRLQRRLGDKRLRGGVATRIKGTLAKIRTGVVPIGAKLDASLRVQDAAASRWARLRAVTVTEGPTVVTDTPGSTSAKVTYDVSDPASSTTASVDVAAKVRKDASQETDPTIDFELGFTVKDKDKGSSSTTELALPLHLNGDQADRCPSAAGVANRGTRFEFRRTTRERRTKVGVEYENTTVNGNGKVTLKGTAGRDAALKSIEYTGTMKLGAAYAASGLKGLARANSRWEFSISSTGTMNPQTGTITGGSETLTGTLRDLSLNARQEEAELAKQLGDPATRKALLDILANLLEREFKGMKEAEKHWQTPNTCATAELTPASATLGEGETTAVTGGVKAKDGAPADGDWTLQTRTRGNATALPGTSSAAARISLTMTAEAPGAADRTADLLLRATSPAGVATAPWTATAPETALYFRVVGASASQDIDGTLSNANCSSVGAPDGVGPWTFALQPTAGEPDGQLSLDGAIGGGVRASGVSTRPAWTYEATCGAPPTTTTTPKDPIVSTGRFGPLVSFYDVPGDAGSVRVVWDVLAPAPIFQQEALGPSCIPQTLWIPGFNQQLPLSTLRQATPFTLSVNTAWTVDRTLVDGHTTCSGTTALSLTLQRVKADGSPLG
ncbi:MAG: hypothetical protein JWO02_3125 [Solirubrobacterales bacterium]|nr:hypothetical protein [Solirubrobacterales bacterium]